MALAELCGMQNFDLRMKENWYASDVFKFDDNFINNLELAVPPFSNVRTYDSVSVYC